MRTPVVACFTPEVLMNWQVSNRLTHPEVSLICVAAMCVQVVVTAMHGGCNCFAVQVHYFIWQGNVISGQHTACCMLEDGQQLGPDK